MATYELSTNNTIGTPPSLWNWATLMEYARNITHHRLDIARNDSDSTYFVVITGVLFVLFMIYVVLKYRSKMLCCCCVFKREDGEMFPRMYFVNTETGSDFVSTTTVPAITGTHTSISKGSPPPPYEHPPPYHVAVQMESGKENEKE